MTATERLSALDASFLHAETPETPLHVGSISVMEGGPLHDEHGRFRFEEALRYVESRLDWVPRFRKRVVFVPFRQGRPVWVDDPEFDVLNHVRLVDLPPPGTMAQLRELGARLHMQLLNRAHPLWELWFVDGVEGNRVGMIEKVHHAMVDGVSTVDVTTATLSFSPDVPLPPTSDWRAEPLPSAAELLAGAWSERLVNPTELIRTVRAGLRGPGRIVRTLRDAGDGLLTVFRDGPVAAGSSLNRAPVGRHRKLEVVRQSLDDLKRMRASVGGTVNDVVLTAVTGGLRHLLVERGEEVDGRVLKALVPVSLRSVEHEPTLGNQVAAMFAPLPVGITDTLERHAAVRAAMARLKAHHEAALSASLIDLTDHIPQNLIIPLVRQIHRQPFVNLVVTNVPGPQQPWYFMGARLLAIDPIVPLASNLTVGIAIFSYDGTITLGLYADSELCPDVAVLADGIEKSFADLQNLSHRPTHAP